MTHAIRRVDTNIDNQWSTDIWSHLQRRLTSRSRTSIIDSDFGSESSAPTSVVIHSEHDTTQSGIMGVCLLAIRHDTQWHLLSPTSKTHVYTTNQTQSPCQWWTRMSTSCTTQSAKTRCPAWTRNLWPTAGSCGPRRTRGSSQRYSILWRPYL